MHPLLPDGLAEVLGDAHVALLEVVRPPKYSLSVPDKVPNYFNLQ